MSSTCRAARVSFWHPLLLVQLAALCVLPAGAVNAQGTKIFDGTPKLILTFNQWSWQLGKDLGSWFGWNGYDYLERGGCECNDMPIDNDLNVTSWLKGFDLARYSDGSKPVVMVIPVSGTPVTGPSDSAAIRLAIRKIEKATEELKKLGVAEVFVSTKHFRYGRARESVTSIGDRNDTLITNEYNRLTGKNLGVNVMTPSLHAFPYTMQTDLEHPTATLHRAYTAATMSAFYLHDGDTIPTTVMTSIDNKKQSDVTNFARLGVSWVNPTSPGEIRIGQQVTVEVSLNDSKLYDDSIKVVLLGYHGYRVLEYLMDMKVLGGAKTNVTFTVPDSAALAIYYVNGVDKPAVQGDSARIMVFPKPGWQTAGPFAWTDPLQILNRDGSPARPPVSVIARHELSPETFRVRAAVGDYPLDRSVYPWRDLTGRLVRTRGRGGVMAPLVRVSPAGIPARTPVLTIER